MSGDSLLAKLELAISREDGLELLRTNFRILSDELANKLTARAKELKVGRESVLSEDFDAWAVEARALVTRRLALAVQGNDQRAAEFLRTQAYRFDDAFYDLCFRIGSHSLDAARDLLESDKANGDAIDEDLREGGREIDFLSALGQLTKSPQYFAKTRFLAGLHLLLRSEWRRRQGQAADADKDAAEAEKALRFAAASPDLPAAMRALSEMRLARLAGSSKPDVVARHQQAALSVALEGGAWEAVRVVRRDLAYWAKQRGDWKTAWDLYRQNVELSEKEIWGTPLIAFAASLERQAQPDYEGAVEAALQLGKSDPAFYERALESAEQGKARAFLRGLATIGTAFDQVMPKLAERRNRILQRMSELPSGTSTYREAERLSGALETVEAQMWAHPRRWALDLRCSPCNFDDMRALVPDDGAILCYYAFENHLIVFVLEKSGLATPPIKVDVQRHDLARWKVELLVLMRMRGDYESIDALQRKLDMEIPALNAPLYLHYFHDALIRPVVKYIEGKRSIVVVPHRLLSGLPYHAFTDASGRAVVEDFAVSYAAGLSVLRWCQARPRTGLTTCFAAGVGRLAGGPRNAKPEAAAVAQQFGCSPSPATCEAVVNNAGSCDVVHLSCHSDLERVFTNFAGLQLEDGPLRQQEITALQCRSALVTLSACSTATSDMLPQAGAELAGLIGAFFRAGCPTVVASQWPLADSVTVLFSEAFYTGLKKGGLNKAEALRQAQLAVKGQAGYHHPYFWAPMCLWGNV